MQADSQMQNDEANHNVASGTQVVEALSRDDKFPDLLSALRAQAAKTMPPPALKQGGKARKQKAAAAPAAAAQPEAAAADAADAAPPMDAAAPRGRRITFEAGSPPPAAKPAKGAATQAKPQAKAGPGEAALVHEARRKGASKKGIVKDWAVGHSSEDEIEDDDMVQV